MIDTKKTVSILKALSCPNRYLIVRFLANGSRCAGSIARHLEISAGAVSQHLHRLLESNIVTANKSGNFVHYSLNLKTLEETGNQLISFSEIETEDQTCKRKEQDCV